MRLGGTGLGDSRSAVNTEGSPVSASAPFLAATADRSGPGGRVVLLDALRGVCFVVMTVDHLRGNPFVRVSNPEKGLLGFFTAALGFVFLSGLVAGLVYERERAFVGTRSMVWRVVRRARALYFTQMVVLASLAVGVALHRHHADQSGLNLFADAPWKGIALGATLIYEPGYLGILPMYLLFLLLTPVVLWQFGMGNARYVLALSALLWVVSGLVIRLPEDPSGVDLAAFNPIGYQFLFVVGLAFGSGHLSIERLSRPARRWLIIASAVVATFFLILRIQYACDGPANALVDSLSAWFSVEQLGPLRLINFAAFALVLYAICRHVQWNEVHSNTVRWLSFLGRHSLPVFAWSILAAYASMALFPPHVDFIVGLLAVPVVAASLTLPAQLHAMFSRRYKKPASASAPSRARELATVRVGDAR